MDLLVMTMALLPWIAEYGTKRKTINACVRTEALTPAPMGTEAAPKTHPHREPEL
jgi:hypothetical protein